MRIVRAELFELSLPLVEPFVISGGTIVSRRSLIVILHDDAGHAGYGECPPFELPFYSEETLAGARDLIERVLLPRVTGRDFDGPLPEAVDAALREGVRGNWFARAALETAAWDLEAHARGVGLATLLGERLAVKPASAVDCGVALGIPPERRAETLTKWVYEAVQRGYRRVKIKVAPGWDAVAVAAARTGMAGTTLPLTVDANGAYEWPRDEAALRALDDAGLLYIEQPLHPDELVGHAPYAGLSRRDAARCASRPANHGAGWPQGLEHQSASCRRPDRSLPPLPPGGALRRPIVGRDDAGIGYWIAGGARGGVPAAVRVSVLPRAVDPFVRPQRRRDQADHGAGRPHAGAGAVLRPPPRSGTFSPLDVARSFGAP